MGHDLHFLERLSRVEAEDESLALSLYQDPQLVRTILSLAELPDGAERVALALQHEPEGPHVVVSRDGAFVTCLGAGMSTGSNPILTRHQLEGMRVRAERVRAALQLARELSGNKTPEGRPITGRLMRVGPTATFADYELTSAFLPILGRGLVAATAGLYTSLIDAYKPARRLVKLKNVKRSKDIELLRTIYFALWGVGHYLVILASDPHVFKYSDERFFAEFSPLWMGLRLRSAPIAFRALWSTARFAPLCFKPQRGRLDEALTPDSLDCAALGLTVSGCRHSKLRDEAVRLLERAQREPVARREARWLEASRLCSEQRVNPVEESEGWGIYRNSMLQNCITQLKTNLDAGTMMRAARAVVGGHMVERGLGENVDDFSDEFIRWALVSGEGPLDSYGLKFLSLFLPLVANFNAADFFLPPELEKQHADLDEVPLARVLDLLREDGEARGSYPVVRPVTPKRNDPCPCGSGLKYKACCVRKDN